MSRFGAAMFQRVWEHLLPREVLGIGRLEYLGWRLVAEQQQRMGARVVHRLARAHPELLVTRPAPWGAAHPAVAPIPEALLARA
jgi:hypothetical protein